MVNVSAAGVGLLSSSVNAALSAISTETGPSVNKSSKKV